MMTSIRFLSLAGCLLVAATLRAQQPQSYNTTLFGKLDPETQSGSWKYSSLIGYAHPNGREYALIGGYSGTYIVDVTDKPIRQVAFIAGPASGWRELKTVGNYAYIVSEGGSGLQIVDLSQLPASATLIRNDTTYFRTAHTITAEGTYLYVNGTGASAGANGGVIILDITNPTGPVKVGQWTERYSHDCTVRNDTLYVAAINDGQLNIIALGADRKAPHTVATITYPGAGTHNCALTPDGSYVMTTDEINATPKTLKVWDRRDVGNISKVADYTPVPNEIIHNVHMKGTTAYIAWYSAGTRIIDMSKPEEPAELGYYDTYPTAENNYVGNWGTYPYLPSGKIISSDMQTGLYVFTFNGAKRGNVHGVVRDAATNDPVPNATVVITRFGRTITADAQGRYNYSGAVDSLAYMAGAPNYQNAGGTLVLTEAGTAQDILLPSLPLASFSVKAVDGASGQPVSAFSYRIIERTSADGHADANPQVFRVPLDSTYHIYVGAWGYHPTLLTLTNPSGVIEARLDPGYFDDVELDLGWSLGLPTDNAKGGAWERGVPTQTDLNGVIVQPDSDHSVGFRDHAFITGIANSDGGVGANDVDDGITTLTTPPMDLSTYADPILTCWLWYSRDARTDVVNDTLQVLVSGDNGGTWHTIERITDSPQRWTPRRYRLRDYLTQFGSQTLFRIVASDLYAQSLVEAGLDDFAVADSGKPAAGVGALQAGGVVTGFGIHPNPIVNTATLELTLAEPQQNARLDLFDASGRRVRTIYTGGLEQGARSFPIDASGLPSGRYAWSLRLDDGAVLSRSILVVR
ncbi:MAG TPA: choice-of-anchor B family protein [Candidatus Kapabacteria bacterium]|nr:choice-of-anchor B family protein [Candidatus Kapabacteria bacterium]